MKWLKPNGVVVELHDRPSSVAAAKAWGLTPEGEANGKRRGRPPGSKNKVQPATEEQFHEVPDDPQTESVSALGINIPGVTEDALT